MIIGKKIPNLGYKPTNGNLLLGYLIRKGEFLLRHPFLVGALGRWFHFQ